VLRTLVRRVTALRPLPNPIPIPIPEWLISNRREPVSAPDLSAWWDAKDLFPVGNGIGNGNGNGNGNGTGMGHLAQLESIKLKCQDAA
jgi:hypothetical protein